MAARIIIALLAAFLLTGPAIMPADEMEAIIDAQCSEQQMLAEWALERCEAADLTLPNLIIEFAGRDLSRCGGAPGSTYLALSPIRVKMCWNSKFILLHELAHVWLEHNIPADKQEGFMTMRADVVSWAGTDAAWEQRGNEHAANVIAWGLLEEPFSVSRTYPNDPDSLRAAFEFLTGTQPLHDGGPGTVEPDRQFFSPDRTNPPLESGR